MLCGRVTREGSSEWRLTLYTTSRKRRRRRLAVIIGSTAYIELALVAVGLSGLSGLPLPKDGHGRQSPLVGSQPAHRNTKRLR